MQASYWHERWQTNQIAFHEIDGNAMLVATLRALSLPEGSSIFVPLCGKSRDVARLLALKHRVVAVELSELAVQQLFQEMKVEPTISAAGRLKCYAGDDLRVFVGDLFELDRSALGLVDAVYDRAALVALPADMRRTYADHLFEITGGAPQLVVCFEYDQRQMDSPPFSVDTQEMAALYAQRYELSSLARTLVEGGLKGIAPVLEAAWLLRPREVAPPGRG